MIESDAVDVIVARIGNALDKLKSLRDDDLAVVELVDCGQAAIAPLRKFLFAREPSGLFYPRSHAAEALGRLGAKDVLLDFLTHPRIISDPVESTGEDAVINAVARALDRWRDDTVFAALLAAVKRRRLPGVIDALGAYRRNEPLPFYIEALADDFCRPAAEAALRKLGASVCPALSQLAVSPMPSPDRETETSRRCRRSALGLLIDMSHDDVRDDFLWTLSMDGDARIAMLACSWCLSSASFDGKDKAVPRLVDLLEGEDWMLQTEIGDILTRHYEICGPIIKERLHSSSGFAAALLRNVVAKCEP